MKKIEGSPKSLKQLLQNTKYSIHYYQREYMWQRKHIEELIDDLTSEFLDYYVPGDSRQKVQDYGAYFMGSIVLAGRENAIIDGQQRLTTVTLLLLAMGNLVKEGRVHTEEDDLNQQILQRFIIAPWAKKDDKIKLNPVRGDRSGGQRARLATRGAGLRPATHGHGRHGNAH